MGRSARGTQANPLSTGIDDFLANFSGRGFDGSAFTGGVARMSLHAAESFTSSAQGAYIAFETTATQTVVLAERMRIASNGNVGIGTPNPVYKLDVNGTTHISGNVTVDGNLAAKYQDVAEWVRSDESLEPGTVVVLDTDHKNQVKRSSRAYDTAVAGVVSAAPGIILGEPSDEKAKIATTGRVKVHVDASTGAVHIGDLLVTSDKSGLAMKSQAVNVAGITMHRPGTIIGKALEPLDRGTGEILVLLSLQ